MKLIVGLGNPGKQYEKTRHNVGFMALDKMASDFKFVKKFNAEISIHEHAAVLRRLTERETTAERNSKVATHSGRFGDVAEPTRKQLLKSSQNKTILAKPQTFMNLSGHAIRTIMSFYKINTEDLVVIHDDLDIEIDEFKIQNNRSSAGHNGVQSIIDSLGTQNFTRVRIGIKNKQPNIVAEKFVLEKFSKDELEIIDEVIKRVKILIFHF